MQTIIVSGENTPAAGRYTLAGLFGGHPYYMRDVLLIYYSSVMHTWIIGNEPSLVPELGNTLYANGDPLHPTGMYMPITVNGQTIASGVLVAQAPRRRRRGD